MSSDDRRADVAAANRVTADMVGQPLVQFCMGYAVHLNVGRDFEVTIECPLEVTDDRGQWRGDPLTAEAAGALLPIVFRTLTDRRIADDGTLVLGFGTATLSVPPNPDFEAWQIRGPNGVLVVCSPGGEYLAVWS